MEKHLDKVCWTAITTNPGALPLLEKYAERAEWFDKDKHHHDIPWGWLSQNPNVVPFLEKHEDKIEWDKLSENPNAIHLLQDNLDKVNWYNLSQNPNAIPILEQHLDKVEWSNVCMNPNGIALIETNLENLDPEELSLDWLASNPNAIPFLQKHPHLIDWHYLSGNPNGLPLLEKNLGDICWSTFSLMETIVPFLKIYPGFIRRLNWELLSFNESAIEMLKAAPEKIHWSYVSQNPKVLYLLELDYPTMKENARELQEELAARVFDPDRMCRMAAISGIDMREYIRHF
jgi:hypothetical protein